MDGRVLRLAVHRIAFLRPAEKRRLEEALEGGLELSSLGFSELEIIVGRLLRVRSWRPSVLMEGAERDAELLERRGFRYIEWLDAEYPALLREIHDPPYGLFAVGERIGNQKPAIAIVGTRQATGIGLAASTDFGRDLALAGLPVVSGLARGIDAAAHRGALAAMRISSGSAAPTIAVLPVGIDSIYPPSHRGLASAIIEKGGTILSEYPPGTLPATWRFPERNRVIAGMARGTLVVEAPLKSGALITASHALETGRDVFVAEATLEGSMNAGADALASEGAFRLSSAGALLAEWGLGGKAPETESPARQSLGARIEAGDETFLAAALRAELGLSGADFPPMDEGTS